MNRAIAALVAVAFAFPALILALGLHEGMGGSLLVGSLLFTAVLVLGFPSLALFCKRQWWELWRFILGGTLGGALCAAPFVSDRFSPIYLIIILALGGAVSSILFWFAGIWRNENLTCPKQFCLPCGVAYRYARHALRRRPG
ncbi:MAG: hypothetical protein Q7U97_11505 [Rhodocyclaceae bacterium]|nr:hypothetical protein [Rhodocyclaceae bacterium]